MTHYYRIKSRYINSQETFVYAIIGCIYAEIFEEKKPKGYNLDDTAEALCNFTRCIKEILVAYREPSKGFLECYDILDSCHRARSYSKLQKFTDDLMKFLDEEMVVIFDSGSVKPYLDFLPDFRKKIDIICG